MSVAAFEYEFAMSFAGEQRTQVEEIASSLRAKGVSVFYDEYEKYTLWGKDLYQHLHGIYSAKARYCIIFASKEYAAKAWTNHELKSAQERALAEKGDEYILPVRFDETQIPGLRSTTFYLDYQKEGQVGIVSATLFKLGRVSKLEALAQVSDASGLVTVASSPLAYVRSVSAPFASFPLIENSEWEDVVTLEAIARNTDEDGQFARMRGMTGNFIVVFGFDVALCTLTSVGRSFKAGQSRWKLTFQQQRKDFDNSSYEVSVGSKSPDDFAQMRAERILLGLHLPIIQSGSKVEQMNSLFTESYIRGLNAMLPAEKCILPELWEDTKESPQEFLDIAWPMLVAAMRLSDTVEHIERLHLSLNGASLNVEFRGVRRKRYSNQEPAVIKVSGEVALDQGSRVPS